MNLDDLIKLRDKTQNILNWKRFESVDIDYFKNVEEVLNTFIQLTASIGILRKILKGDLKWN